MKIDGKKRKGSSSRTSLSSCENPLGVGPVPKKKSILRREAMNREETETLLSNESSIHRFHENGAEDTQSTTPLIDDSYNVSPCSTPEKLPLKSRPNYKKSVIPSRALPESGKIAPRAKFPSIGSDISDSSDPTDESDGNPSISPKDANTHTGMDPLGVCRENVKKLSACAATKESPSYECAINMQSLSDRSEESTKRRTDPANDNHVDTAQMDTASQTMPPCRDKDGNTVDNIVINNVGIAHALEEPIAYIDDP